MAVVFVLYWVGFGSLMIPFRAIFSMCFAIAWVFGLSVLVYQNGILKWSNFAPLSPTPNGKDEPEMCWLIPVMAFSIMVGLSLDYDVFLVSRIVEYRAEGKSDRESVLLGLAKTGRIITAAGIIMAIAFFGLLLSDQVTKLLRRPCGLGTAAADCGAGWPGVDEPALVLPRHRGAL